MPQEPAPPRCPHCGSTLVRFTLPDESGWQDPYHWACFDDECPYFRRGWVVMFERYGVKSSYRYRLDYGLHESPLAVWSKTAIRDRILDGDAGSGTGSA